MKSAFLPLLLRFGPSPSAVCSSCAPRSGYVFAASTAVLVAVVALAQPISWLLFHNA